MAENTSEDRQPGEIIRAFLLNPSRLTLEPILKHTVVSAVKYLRYLKRCGYALPLNEFSSESALQDLAYDATAELFASDRGVPYKHVFDYFQRHGVWDFHSTSIDELHRHFQILLRGFIRRHLPDPEPQVTLLKRSIHEALKGEQFVVSEFGNVSECVWLKSNPPTAACEPRIVDQSQLETIVEVAYLDTSVRNRPTWCQKVLELLGEEEGFVSAVPRRALVAAMIRVNCRQVEVDGLA
ncbi:hypothetical protein GF377_00400, partial [candidate division GN15 bacterium]|nr:hypothetical protein [candidate division GN15 bacterium]